MHFFFPSLAQRSALATSNGSYIQTIDCSLVIHALNFHAAAVKIPMIQLSNTISPELLQVIIKANPKIVWPEQSSESEKFIYSVADKNYLLILRQMAFEKMTTSTDPAHLFTLYQKIWLLLVEAHPILDKTQLNNIMQLLLILPYQEDWPEEAQPDTCLVNCSNTTITNLFGHLKNSHADRCLRLLIQALPAKRAEECSLALFSQFDLEDVGLFIDLSYEHLYSPLWAAVMCSQSHLVRSLLALGADVNTKDMADRPLLVAAVIKEDEETLKMLLAAPELILDARDKMDCTALYWACQQKKDNMALLLLQDPRIGYDHYSTVSSYSALHWALLNNMFNVAQKLIEKSCDLSKKDLINRAPVDLIKQKGLLSLEKQIKISLESSPSL